MDYNKRHIETEIKFYSKMNKKRSLLLSLIIVGIGYTFLAFRFWSIGFCGGIKELFWLFTIAILFFILTYLGFLIFERERKKWTAKL
jgi:hypothetical protein